MHFVGFIVRIYHDARSSECHIERSILSAVSRNRGRSRNVLPAQMGVFVLVKEPKWSTRPFNRTVNVVDPGIIEILSCFIYFTVGNVF